MKNWYGHILVVCVALGLIAASSASVAFGGNPNPRVLPPNARPHGMTYGEWGAEWWRWIVSLPFFEGDPGDPTPIHPLADMDHDCSHGADGQFGPVWFLAGMPASWDSVERDCTVPTGKALFFPIISFMDASIPPVTFTEEELRDRVAYSMNMITEVEADIDGVPVKNLMEGYHFPSPLFTVGPLPIWNYFGAQVGTTHDAVADGYFLMLAPLSRGSHTVHYAWKDTSWHDVTYYLDVAPE